MPDDTLLIDYDSLKLAAEAAMLSENVQPQDWTAAEGFEEEGFMRFCIEEAQTLLENLPEGRAATLMLNPLAGVVTGMVLGARYVNIVNRARYGS